MFLDKSRYAKVGTVETEARGRRVVAIRLRRLPAAAGEPYVVQESDRLDLLAHARYGNATAFWHVADANTALDSRTLVTIVGDMIDVPRT
jgi:hypothetical protein